MEQDSPARSGLPCAVPMWPDGPECLERRGHDGYHHGLSPNIQWSYTACWQAWTIDGVEYHCLAPQDHEGGHAGG